MRQRIIFGMLAACLFMGAGAFAVQAEEVESVEKLPVEIVLFEGERTGKDDEGIEEGAPFVILDQERLQSSRTSDICSAEEWDVLYLTNVERTKRGKFAISTYHNLQNAADVRAGELVREYKGNHKRPNGAMWFTALSEAGVSYKAAGENIAAGQKDSAKVMDSWLNSPGHKSNILDEKGSGFSHMGVGYAEGGKYGKSWVQLFTGGCCSVESVNVSSMRRTSSYARENTIDALGLILEVHCKQHGISYLPVLGSMCEGYNDSLGSDAPQNINIHYYDVNTGKKFIVPVKIGGEGLPFGDVREKDWYAQAVGYVYKNQLMTGLNGSTFAPEHSLARAQFAVILHRMNGAPEVKYDAKFSDVKIGQWYTNAILWANNIGVVNGYSNSNRFGTSDKINREQMAVMMYRYAQYQKYEASERAELDNFKDASKVNSFAKEAMQWAVGSGIITGKDNGVKLDPQGNASRAECAVIIMRFVEKYK